MKKCRTVNWKHIYSSAQQQLKAWNEPVTVFERSPLPHELFELLLTNTEMERICIEATNYSRLKGSYMFTMTEKLEPFPRFF